MLIADQLLQMANNMKKGVFVGGTIFGPAQMAHQDNAASIGQYFLDSGDSCPHAGIVSYLKIFIEWHIEIYANQCFEALEVELTEVVHGTMFKKQARQGYCRA